MSEYGQIVGTGSQVAGGHGVGHAVGSGAQSGDPMGQLSALIDSASTTAAGLPPAVLAVLAVFAVIVLLVFLRRVFG